MFTNRISNLVLVLLVLVAALLTVSFATKPASHATDSVFSDSAHYQFRLSEIAERAKPVDARYQFRLDEISQMAKAVDARYLFRLDEIAQIANPIDARYEWRRGEWFGN